MQIPFKIFHTLYIKTNISYFEERSYIYIYDVSRYILYIYIYTVYFRQEDIYVNHQKTDKKLANKNCWNLANH